MSKDFSRHADVYYVTQRARQMKRTSSKAAKDRRAYAYIPFRPTPLMNVRLRKLAENSGQTIGAIIRECVSAHLQKLESTPITVNGKAAA